MAASIIELKADNAPGCAGSPLTGFRVLTFLEQRDSLQQNWAEADRIRGELTAMGISLKDAKNPVTGEIETTWEIAR